MDPQVVVFLTLVWMFGVLASCVARLRDQQLEEEEEEERGHVCLLLLTSGEEEGACPICLLPLVPSERLAVRTECGHRFHLACLKRWLSSDSNPHTQCAMCRTTLLQPTKTKWRPTRDGS